MTLPPYSTWLEIDLEAIRSNVRRLAQLSGRPVMTVLKANAYGHGLVEVARAVRQAGASWIGIARVEEGLILRQGGITGDILVMGHAASEQVPQAAQADLTLAVYHPELAAAYSARAEAAGLRLRVHAKFDSGMGRLGLSTEEGMDFVRLLLSLPGLALEGVFTHLAEADDPVQPSVNWQVERFTALVDALASAGLRPPLVHAANSAGTIYFPDARFDMIRPGIAVYGLQPSADAPLPEGFRPALTWKARLASIKVLPPNHGIGYNYRYRTTREERIGVCPAGYADGLRRKVGVNFVLVGGVKVPVVGGMCMDQCMIQLDGVPGAKLGDEIVLIGRQGAAEISAEDIARVWDTTNYDVVCGLTARVPRLYLNT